MEIAYASRSRYLEVCERSLSFRQLQQGETIAILLPSSGYARYITVAPECYSCPGASSEGVMPALLIADIEVTDAAGYEEYQRQVPAYVAAYDGRFIVRGGQTQVLEGSWPAHRVVVIEFPSMASCWPFMTRPSRDAEVAPDACIRLPDHRRRRSGRPATAGSHIIANHTPGLELTAPRP